MVLNVTFRQSKVIIEKKLSIQHLKIGLQEILHLFANACCYRVISVLNVKYYLYIEQLFYYHNIIQPC